MSRPRTCTTCGSALARDQRYCLSCGARAGERSPQLEELLRCVAEHRDEPSQSPPQLEPEPEPSGTGLSSLTLPGPWVSMLLVAAFVGFGALLGDAASQPARLAASTAPLRVVVPHAASSGSTAAPESGGASSHSSEPPSSEPEATPAPEQSAAAAPAKTAGGQAASGGSEGQGSSEREHSSEGSSGGSPAPARKLAEIRHVFVIVLDDEPYAADFGPESKDRYLAGTLEGRGELLQRVDAIGHQQLPNGVALVSGQGPTAQTAEDCPAFAPLAPGGVGADGQALGQGCVYPSSVGTLPGQLSAKHRTWRAYVQGIDEGAGTPGPCAHPADGEADATAAGGAYATSRNPFVYFASLTSSCASDDVGLSRLSTDLDGSAAAAPSFSYIVPDRCDDAGPSPCTPGGVAGPADAAPFLQKVVPVITGSKAYEQDGLIVITADEAPSSGEFADSSSCCGQPASYPNYKAATIGHGGGNVGALLLSPLIKGGTKNAEPYDHYSLLRTFEDIFGLAHLGYAGLPAVKSLSTSLLNAPAKG